MVEERLRVSLGCISSNMPVELDSTESALAVFKFLVFSKPNWSFFKN